MKDCVKCEALPLGVVALAGVLAAVILPMLFFSYFGVSMAIVAGSLGFGLLMMGLVKVGELHLSLSGYSGIDEYVAVVPTLVLSLPFFLVFLVVNSVAGIWGFLVITILLTGYLFFLMGRVSSFFKEDALGGDPVDGDGQ